MPNIRAQIAAQGGKSVITVKQLMGRAIRHDGKNWEVFYYDFYDDGKWLSKHSLRRISIYRKEGFEITTSYPHRKYKPVSVL